MVSFVSEAHGWQGVPESMEDLLASWFPRKFGVGVQTGLACFVSVAWAVWNTRNKICINHSFPNRPLDIVYLALFFIQKWSVLMKSSGKTKVESLTRAIQEQARNFNPLCSEPTDIGFI
jgi:hypothetical protein